MFTCFSLTLHIYNCYRIKIREPTHPQPATVTTKMPNKSTVRTSDVRVSERVSQTQVTLNLYKTVFNELTDEVRSWSYQFGLFMGSRRFGLLTGVKAQSSNTWCFYSIVKLYVQTSGNV